MNLVMLSGNSMRNHDWIYQAKEQVSTPFKDTYVQDYKHWHTDDEWIDLKQEHKVLAANLPTKPYGVLAKSIGTVLAVQALEQGVLQPEFLLFMGIPLNFITSEYPEFRGALEKVKAPVTFIHNTHDKVGSSKDTKAYLQLSNGSRRFIETPGDTHDYEDYDLLRAELARLVSVTS